MTALTYYVIFSHYINPNKVVTLLIGLNFCYQIMLQDDLINHLKIHAGSRSVNGTMDKKFMCSQCDKKFFTRKDLKRHR